MYFLNKSFFKNLRTRFHGITQKCKLRNDSLSEVLLSIYGVSVGHKMFATTTESVKINIDNSYLSGNEVSRIQFVIFFIP